VGRSEYKNHTVWVFDSARRMGREGNGRAYPCRMLIAGEAPVPTTEWRAAQLALSSPRLRDEERRKRAGRFVSIFFDPIAGTRQVQLCLGPAGRSREPTRRTAHQAH
jgi:hypothetical protein